jgi:hypothetical protein
MIKNRKHKKFSPSVAPAQQRQISPLSPPSGQPMQYMPPVKKSKLQSATAGTLMQNIVTKIHEQDNGK